MLQESNKVPRWATRSSWRRIRECQETRWHKIALGKIIATNTDDLVVSRVVFLIMTQKVRALLSVVGDLHAQLRDSQRFTDESGARQFMTMVMAKYFVANLDFKHHFKKAVPE